MSDTLDKNELENFDSWEKETAAIDDLSFDSNTDFSDSLDLPDFDDSFDFNDTGLSDIFSDDTPVAEDNLGDSKDTTLTSDELNNLTSGIETVTEASVISDETISDFDIPDFDTISEKLDEPLTEEDTVQIESSDSLDKADDFSFDTISDDFETVSENQQTDDIALDSVADDDNFSLDLGDFDSEIQLDDKAFDETSETDLSIDDDSITSMASETIADDQDFDISFDSVEDTTAAEAEESTIEVASNIEESLDIDDFNTTDVSFDEITSESTEETSSSEEEVSFDDEEISLDDFMDGGFSDESVAAGNNGFEPGKGPDAATSEEISLDDFFDGEFSMDDTPQEDEVVDEKPLEMDISFDSSADTVETELNSSVQLDYDDEEEETYETNKDEDIVEEVSVSASSDGIDAEEIDLSDFGIDANAEETPVTQDVESSKNKEQVVDYDLSVQNEITSTAPVVNEVKISDEPLAEVTETLIEEPVSEEKANSVSVDTSLLQQIVADLSSLKAEINSLKSNLAEYEQKEVSESANIVSETPVAAETTDIIPETTENEGGFFSSDDGDDTIALSTDELSNIFNTAEFTENEVSVETTDSTITSEPVLDETVSEPVISDEITIDEPVVQESEEIFDYSTEETAVSESEVEETLNNDNSFGLVSDTFTIPMETSIDETITETNEESVIEETIADEPVFEDSVVEETIADEPVFEDSIVEETVTVTETNETEDDAFASVDDDFSFNSVDDDFDSIVQDSEPMPENVTISDENIETESVEETFEFDQEPASTEDVIPNYEIEPEITIEESTENTVEDSFDISTSELSDFSFEDNESISEEDLPQEISIPKEENSYDEVSATESEDIISNELSDTNGFADFSDFEETSEPVFDNIESEEANDNTQIFEDVFETSAVPGVEENSNEEVQFDSIIDSVEQAENLEATTIVEDQISETEVTAEEENMFADLDSEPAVESENSFDESFFVENEPSTEETSANIPSEEIEDDFLTTEDNNDLSESNIDYLTTEESPAMESAPAAVIPVAATETNTNEELKKDIKSVLLYMDQLLENLPEDKIIEFAKSEEFATYKKLFSELGLS